MADDAFKRAARELDGAVNRAVREVLEASVVPEAKARCPLGLYPPHVRERIHVEAAEGGLEVVGGDREAWYGHIIEFGSRPRRTRDRPGRRAHPTGHMPPHPFLLPVFEANREAIMKAAENAVRKACS